MRLQGLQLRGYFFKCLKAPKGFARFHSNFRLFSTGRDSGKTKKPYRKLINVRPAAAINGTREPYCPSNPPITGPIINPKPKGSTYHSEIFCPVFRCAYICNVCSSSCKTCAGYSRNNSSNKEPSYSWCK